MGGMNGPLASKCPQITKSAYQSSNHLRVHHFTPKLEKKSTVGRCSQKKPGPLQDDVVATKLADQHQHNICQ